MTGRKHRIPLFVMRTSYLASPPRPSLNPLIMTFNTLLRNLLFSVVMLSFVACDSGTTDPCEDVLAPTPAAGGPVPVDVADPEYTVTDSGLKYYDISEGTGPEAMVGDVALVHYTGWLENDFIFDSSVLLNRSPIPVTIGAPGVIQGWIEGLQGMNEGGKRQLVIPSQLAYGSQCRAGSFPSDATMIFEVEIVNLTQSGTN